MGVIVMFHVFCPQTKLTERHATKRVVSILVNSFARLKLRKITSRVYDLLLHSLCEQQDE